MIFSITMLPPLAISLYFTDSGWYAFFAGFVTTITAGLLIWWPVRDRTEELRLRDGFLIVAAFWFGLGTMGEHQYGWPLGGPANSAGSPALGQLAEDALPIGTTYVVAINPADGHFCGKSDG